MSEPAAPPSGSRASAPAGDRHALAGGVSRDQLYLEPPLVVREAAGDELVDVEGNRLVDYVNNYTSLILGHAHPAVVGAIAEQAGRGTAYGAANLLEAELAAAVVARLPGATSLRFTNSGTEAVMLALQIARVRTGRTRIAKFEGGYHGSHELVKVSVKPESPLGDADRPLPVAELEARGFDLTDVLPYHDVEAVRWIAAERASGWAAVILEPMQGSAGMLPAPAGLVSELHRLSIEHGFLLVLDEVMTFRHTGRGLQHALAVTPHLTALGKIIGGGLPVGAVAGDDELMSLVAPPRPDRIHHSGTFNGNPLTAAAGLATLAVYDEAAARALDARGEVLRDRLAEELRPHGLSVTGYGSMLNLHGSPRPPRCWRDVLAGDRARVFRVTARLRDRGHFLAPRGLVCLSTASTAEHLDRLVEDTVAAARATA